MGACPANMRVFWEGACPINMRRWLLGRILWTTTTSGTASPSTRCSLWGSEVAIGALTYGLAHRTALRFGHYVSSLLRRTPGAHMPRRRLCGVSRKRPLDGTKEVPGGTFCAAPPGPGNVLSQARGAVSTPGSRTPRDRVFWVDRALARPATEDDRRS